MSDSEIRELIERWCAGELDEAGESRLRVALQTGSPEVQRQVREAMGEAWALAQEAHVDEVAHARRAVKPAIPFPQAAVAAAAMLLIAVGAAALWLSPGGENGLVIDDGAVATTQPERSARTAITVTPAPAGEMVERDGDRVVTLRVAASGSSRLPTLVNRGGYAVKLRVH